MQCRVAIVGFLVLAGCPAGSSAPPSQTPVVETTSDDPPTAIAAEPDRDPGAPRACGAAFDAAPAPAHTGDPTSDALLAAHNRVRANHCAAPLAWSPALAAEATAWARSLAQRNCAFEHSSTPHGENLAGGTASALGPDEVVAMWADEVAAYDFAQPGFGMATGHFTQVVWKGTTHVGCGAAMCNGMSRWVCNYDPAGNVEGDFATNVTPAVR